MRVLVKVSILPYESGEGLVEGAIVFVKVSESGYGKGKCVGLGGGSGQGQCVGGELVEVGVLVFVGCWC